MDYEQQWANIENQKLIDPKQSQLLSLIKRQGTANINFLIEHSGLDWKTINYKLNGLVQRKMIIKNNQNHSINQ